MFLSQIIQQQFFRVCLPLCYLHYEIKKKIMGYRGIQYNHITRINHDDAIQWLWHNVCLVSNRVLSLDHNLQVNNRSNREKRLNKHWIDKSRKESIFGLDLLSILVSMNHKSLHFEAIDFCMWEFCVFLLPWSWY